MTTSTLPEPIISKPTVNTGSHKFTDMPLAEPLQRALAAKNYITPSPIQYQAIPHLLAGRDLIGLAQTGTGKTAAFALPILQNIINNPKPLTPRNARALILAPTRELAVQIGQSFADYGKFIKVSYAVVFGGVSIFHQIRAMSRGVDVLIATPGRLMDLHKQKYLNLDQVEVFVLDEVDRMLDMGFVHDVKKIIAKLPAKRQALLFSATMPREIEDIAHSLVHNPAKVTVTPVSSTVDKIEQQVVFVDRDTKRQLLSHFIGQYKDERVLIFVRMKHMANRLAEMLAEDGFAADAIHGNKSQGARQRALENFRTGQKKILVATDIASRGIDVKEIALVVNFDLPEEPEAYVHRIGRTARAGAGGRAVSFCDRSERGLLRSVERCIDQQIPVLKVPGFDVPAHAGSNDKGDHERRRGPVRNSGNRPMERTSHFRPQQSRFGGNRPQRPNNGENRPQRFNNDRPAQPRNGENRPTQQQRDTNAIVPQQQSDDRTAQARYLNGRPPEQRDRNRAPFQKRNGNNERPFKKWNNNRRPNGDQPRNGQNENSNNRPQRGSDWSPRGKGNGNGGANGNRPNRFGGQKRRFRPSAPRS